MGNSGARVGASSGTHSPPTSSARGPRGEEALGGLSLNEEGRPAEEEWEVAVVAALRLLKTGASIVSSSSSEVMNTTPLPFSMGAGGREALTVAKGISTMGAEEAGAGVVWVEGGTGVVWVAGGVGDVEAAVAAVASSRMDRTSTNLSRFSAFNTIPAPKEGELRT